MLFFLHLAWGRRPENMQIPHQLSSVSALVPLGNGISSHRGIAFNENLISQDNLYFSAMGATQQSSIHEFVKNESGKKLYSQLNSTSPSDDKSDPVVSIIIATNNEQDVIERLLNSIERLTYNRDRFEVIVVDDSTDLTAKILEDWTKKMKNLSIIKRKLRIGSKGRALNLALESLRKDSSWILIIDADTILPSNIIEQFLSRSNGSQNDFKAIQGYCIPYNGHLSSNPGFANWVSRGIEFRLAQRNMIEFVAKKKLGLPVQITGNLFMIKTSILKQICFSADICEDWDLTLDLYLRKHDSEIGGTNILFDETLNAGNQAPVSLGTYFRQRLRVSEGHTRGFIKKIPTLILKEQSLKNKIEIFITGFRYLRYLLFVSLLVLDFIGLALIGTNELSIYLMSSFAIQFFCLGVFIVAKGLGLVICKRNMHYTIKFLMSELIVEICVVPALTLGSLLAIFRKKGSFHRTQRIGNNARNII